MIVLGYDDSPSASAALAAARDLAQRDQDELLIITAYDYESQSLSARQGVGVRNASRAAAAEALAQAAAALLDGPTALTRTEPGPLADAAAQVARETNARTVVLGRTPPLVDHLGRIERDLPCPLVVVPAAPVSFAEQTWRAAVDAARLAPSSHNTQPWELCLTADGLDVIADTTRALDATDPDHRELTISCGAVLHHLRVALGAAGHGVTVAEFPDADPPVVARLTLDGHREPTEAMIRMEAALHERHTDRGEYIAEPLPAEPFDHLRVLAADEGARLTVIRDPTQRHALAELVEQADRTEAGRHAAVTELAAWVRLPGRHRSDGLPLRTMFERPGHRATREAAQVAAGPVLALLTTTTDRPRDWLAAGQALSAVLLEATAHGLSCSFFSAPLHDAALRAELAKVAGATHVPQVLLRFGHGVGGRPSPRRPVDELIA